MIAAMKRTFALLALVIGWIVPVTGQPEDPLAEVLNATRFRNIGPFRTAAWVTEIAVPESPARDHLFRLAASHPVVA